MRVLGVDGCKQGWVGVALEDGRLGSVVLRSRFVELVEAAEGVDIIGVDMPIGLLDDGWRDCDAEVRAFLGARRSSVFLVPPRPVLEAATFDEANARCRGLTGKGLSKQAFALAGKILEVDPIADKDRRISEVHPEGSFQVLAGEPLTASKRTWTGLRQRQELLADAGISLASDIGPAGAAAADDVLDAAVAAWSAMRIGAGEARRFPAETEQRRAGGADIAIWG